MRDWSEDGACRIALSMASRPFEQRFHSPLGLEVHRRREALGWTREQLEAKAGLSPGHLNQIEGGERKRLAPATLAKLASALGCTVDDLLNPIEIPESLEAFAASPEGQGMTEQEKTELARAVHLFGYQQTPATYGVLLMLARSRQR